jgi:hypothetical protein
LSDLIFHFYRMKDSTFQNRMQEEK